MTPPFVDTHLHFWQLGHLPYPWLADPGTEALRHDYLPANLAADAAGLDLQATVHVQAEVDHAVDPVEETAWLASLDGAPTVCVGYADLRAPDVDDVLARHQEYALFRGIRQEAWFDPESTRADVPTYDLLADPAWAAGLRRLAARELSFDLLVWTHQLERAAAVFRKLPELTVVLDHTALADGSEEWRTGIRRFADQVPRSVLKISGMASVSATWQPADVVPVIQEAIEVFGPGRCMFGSNFPVDRPASSYERLWQTYDEATATLSQDERTSLFSGTARRVYRIPT